jgi:hypothetical protein
MNIQVGQVWKTRDTSHVEVVSLDGIDKRFPVEVRFLEGPEKGKTYTVGLDGQYGIPGAGEYRFDLIEIVKDPSDASWDHPTRIFFESPSHISLQGQMVWDAMLRSSGRGLGPEEAFFQAEELYAKWAEKYGPK